MIGINFDREKSLYFVNCLSDGKPIAHEGGWSADDMLALAGACFFAVSSQGPALRKLAKALGQEIPDPHPEHREAEDAQLFADIHGAIEFIAELSMRAYDGEYDDLYERNVRAILRGDTRQVHPLQGFKKLTR